MGEAAVTREMRKGTVPGGIVWGMKTTRLSIGVAALFLAADTTWPHVRLLHPVPRTTVSLKVGPCGGIPRTASPLVLEAGSELELEFEEFVEHPGYYQVFFSTGGDRDFFLLLDEIPDRRVSSSNDLYRVTVTLPSTPCEEGTLQLIQVMTENPERPSLYFSCADIRLVAPARDFRRGDSDADGAVRIADAIVTLDHLFGSKAAPSCRDAADSNDDGELDVSDGIRILVWLFGAGEAPPAPGPEACGPDEPLDAMDCAVYDGCGA